MKRLIYAPKVFIFIRSSNLNRVYDVSSDVVRGSVTQNVNDVSKAGFELRNRYRKWVRSPGDRQKQIFLPMDMVTIWLQRIAGKPIQVFTGYLDACPYYQAYPGNAVFEATCTLKKLAFTWFDPGLTFFQNWVMSSTGWTYDQSTGEALNTAALSSAQSIDANASLAKLGANAKINDSGFDALLGRFMTEIAGWSPDDVLISALPSNLPKLAAKLYAKIEADTENGLTNLESFLSTAMGVNGWTSPSAATPTSTSGAPTQQAGATSLVETISARGKANNIPTNVLVFAAYVLTGLSPDREFSSVSGNANWGYGLYALRPNPISGKSVPGLANLPTLTAYASTIDGKSPSDLLDAATATDVFCKLLNAHQGSWAIAARNGDLASIQQWIEAALGRPLPPGDHTADFNKAQQIAGTSVVVTPPTSAPTNGVDPSTFTWSDPQLLALLTSAEKRTITRYYFNSKPWLGAVLYRAKQVDRTLTLVANASSGNASITLAGSPQSLIALFGSFTGDATLASVDLTISNKVASLKNGVASNVSTIDGRDSAQGGTMVIVQTVKPQDGQQVDAGASAANASAGSATTSPGATDALTPSEFPAFSANAAFAANFSFPTNVVESMFLVGNKALLNDVSCLDGAKQFCKGSLRAFRSLPDGRFLAFYPDYFGAYRKPYWEIGNIEITDFGIQLNDDSLATHVYVTGDTFAADGAITYQDEIASRGVATITQAFMLDSFIEVYKPSGSAPLTSPSMGRLSDAFSFLGHYGARPHKEEQPLIRNTFYEFLMAWQRFMELWAQQFATSVTFTFQPEVMAGGLIAFPDHDVQMFCQSATHNFDYEAGFNTEAVMTAPSLLPGKQVDRQSKPGFALGGNVNSVGSD